MQRRNEVTRGTLGDVPGYLECGVDSSKFPLHRAANHPASFCFSCAMRHSLKVLIQRVREQPERNTMDAPYRVAHFARFAHIPCVKCQKQEARPGGPRCCQNGYGQPLIKYIHDVGCVGLPLYAQLRQLFPIASHLGLPLFASVATTRRGMQCRMRLPRAVCEQLTDGEGSANNMGRTIRRINRYEKPDSRPACGVVELGQAPASEPKVPNRDQPDPRSRKSIGHIPAPWHMGETAP